MGIVLKRRDNAKIVKKIVGQLIIDTLNCLDDNIVINNYKNNINNLFKGHFNISDFVISKTLKSDYKDRTR